MKINILAILSIILITTSCLDDQIQNDFTCEVEGRYLGDFPLTAKTDSLLPYEAGKSLIFVDSLGNEVIFGEEQPLIEEIEERRVRTICGGSWLNVHEFDSYTEHQKRAIYYSNEIQSQIYISAFKSYFEVTDTSFITYDYFSFNVDWSGIQLGYMDDGSDISEYSPFLKEEWVTETVGDTTFLGRSFSHVLKTKFDTNPLYYSKTKGLVAFRSRNNVFWVFDRAE